MEDAQTRSEPLLPSQSRDASKPVTSKFFGAASASTSASGHIKKDPLVLVPASSSPETTPTRPVATSTYVPKMGHHPPTNGTAASTIFKGRMMQDERLKTKATKILAQESPALLTPPSTNTSATSSRASSVRRGREDDDSSISAPPRKKINTGNPSDRSETPDSVQTVDEGVKVMELDSSPQPGSSSVSAAPERPRGRLVRGRQATVTQDSIQSSASTTPSTSQTNGNSATSTSSKPTSVNEMRDQMRKAAMENGTTSKPPAAGSLPATVAPKPNTVPPPVTYNSYVNIYRPPGVPLPVNSYAYIPRPVGTVGYYPVPPGSAAYASPAGARPVPAGYRGPHPATPVGRGTTVTVKSVPAKAAPQPAKPAPKPTKLPSSKSKARRDLDSGSEHEDEESDEGWGSDEDNAATRAARMWRSKNALQWFETATKEELIEVAAITPAQAASIVALRPFKTEDDLRSKFQKQKGISPRYFDDYIRMLEGYDSVDKVIERCEAVGKSINDVLNIWAGAAELSADSSKTEAKAAGDAESGAATPNGSLPTGVDLVAIDTKLVVSDPEKAEALKGYMTEQPKTLGEGVLLKDYQLTGINWLALLYRKELSCILADEMGLGKTIQVIAFLASLKESAPQGSNAVHLIIVPSSTLENWGREFERFAPGLLIETYYGSQNERVMQRATLSKMIELGELDVVITTYNLAQGTEHDRKFFRKTKWDCIVFDEGHVLKNFQSQRYGHLLRIPSRWRLMLTGTPLQNNLQELVSLMNFLLPDFFTDALESLRAIFKVTANSHTSFLSESRVKRASKMMTPFVLRRRKDQVLKDLPKKTERVEWCEMTSVQKSIYSDALKRSRKVLAELPKDEKGLLEAASGPSEEKKKPGRPKKGVLVSSGMNSSNILMDLRKASSHPMLFRRLFDDDKVNVMARHCLSEPEFMQSNYDLVVEDMQVMNDAELQWFCKTYKSCAKHALGDEIFLNSGKITRMLALLEEYKKENKRILIFSQFTQILEILKVILDHQKIRFVVLTGQTPVNERQALVDEYNEDESIPVFLLSTRAGGMGINLTAACVVIIFDQDFNPHNDKQAMDRAYRIGQKRDVEVVKLVTKGTIEENMLRLGQVKLVLDQVVTAGEGNEEEESTTEKTIKASLLSELRKQLEQEEGQDTEMETVDKEETKATST